MLHSSSLPFPGTHPLSSTNEASRIVCIQGCMTNSLCAGVNFVTDSGLCELVDTTDLDDLEVREGRCNRDRVAFSPGKGVHVTYKSR